MFRTLVLAFFASQLHGAQEEMRLPAFPLPALVSDGGPPTEVGPIHFLRELQKAGLHGFDHLDTSDSDYALFRSDSLGVLAAWLHTVCESIGFDLNRARQRSYDGSVFARLLDTVTSLAALRDHQSALAMPVGVVVCKRASAWGELPADGASDAYVIFATENGMLVYDPPTGQLSSLADFPNKTKIVQIRF